MHACRGAKAEPSRSCGASLACWWRTIQHCNLRNVLQKSCHACLQRGQGRTDQELRGRLSMLVVLLGRMTHALDAAAADGQLRARLKALPSMAVMEDYPDGRIRDTVRG